MPIPLPPRASIDDDVARALAEDLGSGDLTASLVPEGATATATVISREAAVLCGRPWVEAVFTRLDPTIQFHWDADEGARVAPDQVILRLEGPARALLSGERAALNFLQTLSGTATAAARYVTELEGTGCRLLDTRKTLPGLRLAQKYAVRAGGGNNHRTGLYDGILIKENHIIAAGSIAAAVKQAKALAGELKVECEVESLDEANEALEAGADILLLDNFSLDALRRAVRLNDGRAKLEASGGVTLESIRAIAETGVDFISVGAITKDLRAVDLSMRFEVRL
ncbi:carboxylating nicotinate-nucleotide diphosphorylase [Endothiovibrio diazotrophicus]